MRGVSAVSLIAVMATSVTLMAQGRQVVPSPANLPFSAAVRADGLVYIAGTIVPEGDIRAQTKAVIESMSQVLQKAGSSLANVASVHVYLTKADDFAAMNEVYRTFWPKDPPVRTTIVSDLVLAGGLVEMSMVAVPTLELRSARVGSTRGVPAETSTVSATAATSRVTSSATA